MKSIGAIDSGWLRSITVQLHDVILREPLEPILHFSIARVRWLAVFTMIGHPLFALIWGKWLPQPYESLELRILIALLGLVLFAISFSSQVKGRLGSIAFTIVCWLQLPVLFTWMFLSNSGNSVWLASLCAAILIYYHATDWRLATVGLVVGVAVAWVLFELIGLGAIVPTSEQVTTNMVVLGFTFLSALLLGISSANLRREHLKNTLSTLGIMAHELRTPLSAMGLISDALQMQSQSINSESVEHTQALALLATRLRALTRSMNFQIDTQISNARLLHLPSGGDRIVASELVNQVLGSYPYRMDREQRCVVVEVHHDFEFRATRSHFSQVLINLIKNAFYALQKASSSYSQGDLRVEVNLTGARGCILVIDRGVGISTESLPHIFEAFFSTSEKTGHGLGLAFCKKVVEAAGGKLSAQSGLHQGARFSIELPVLLIPSVDKEF